MTTAAHELDSRERFSKTVADYVRYRPSYPEALVNWIVSESSLQAGEVVVDVGAGTGISTRLFGQRGFRTIGIEPNEDMRAAAEAGGGVNVEYRAGTSEVTTLPGGIAALITAAQAFHWFDVAKTLAEFRRIGKVGAHAAAFWNARRGSAFNDDYEALLRDVGDYASVQHAEDAKSFFPRDLSAKAFECAHAQTLDREGLSGRLFSSSYVAHGVTDRAAFEQKIDALFARHEKDGRVEFTYVATAALFAL